MWGRCCGPWSAARKPSMKVREGAVPGPCPVLLSASVGDLQFSRFPRAFRRWVGIPPSQLRRMRAGGGEANDWNRFDLPCQ